MAKVRAFFGQVPVPQRAAAVWAGLVLSISATAHAIPAQPSYWRSANLGTPVAQGGVLLFVFEQGDLNGFAEPIVIVLDPMGVEVPGAIEPIDAEGASEMRIFRPSTPFALDGSYQLGGELQLSTTSFELSPDPIAEGMPSGAITLDQAIVVVVSEQSCCQPTGLNRPGAPAQCITLRQSEAASVEIDLAIDATDSSARQYVYRAELTGAPSTSGWQSADDPTRWPFRLDETIDEYCYRVEAHRLTDGEGFVLEEACVERTHGELAGDVDLIEGTLRGQLDARNCSVPPEPLEDAWCEANREVCADPANDAYCGVAPYAELCAGFTNDDGASVIDLIDGDAGDQAGAGGASGGGAGTGGAGGGGAGTGGGIGGAGGTSLSGGAGGAGSEAGMGMSAPSARSSGCSAAPGASQAISSGGLLGLLLLALVRRRAHSQSR